MSTSVEINDAVLCGSHRQEVCTDCNADFREENDAFYGFEPVDREPLSVPALKEGTLACKKHTNAECNQCFNWKKQITKLHKDAKKAGK